MNETYLSPNEEYVYRVVDSDGNPMKVRIAGSTGNKPQYTIRTYNTHSAAAGVVTRKNNALGRETYRVQVSKVEWRDFDPVTLEIAS
jgi:hypothetical protein